MKSVVIALCFVVVGPGSALAAPKPDTGWAVLSRSKAAYAAVRTYSGHTEIHDACFDKRGKVVDRGVSTADVVFSRPKRIKVRGTLSGSKRGEGFFEIASDGNATWVRWSKKPDWGKAKNLEMAVAAMTGVSGSASTTIPAALAQLNWGNPFPMNSQGVDNKVASERVRGRILYRVRYKSDDGVTTFWIDPKTMLLAQMRQHAEGTKLRSTIPNEWGVSPKDLKELGSVTLDTLEVYSNVRINRPIPEAALRLPTQSPRKKSPAK